MVHVSCDLCGKELVLEGNYRFVVKMEVYAAHDPNALTEADLDEDHMEALSQLLRNEAEQLDDPDLTAHTPKNFRYDLCPECHKKFIRDPLSREAAQKFDFSKN